MVKKETFEAKRKEKTHGDRECDESKQFNPFVSLIKRCLQNNHVPSRLQRSN